MSKIEAREYFAKGCNEYLRLFCEKHDFDFEDAKQCWVGGEIGGIVCCADYYVGLQTIIDDIEMDAPKDEFIKWYDYCLDAGALDIASPSYKHWLKGCPRMSEETINRLKNLQGLFVDAIKEEKDKLKY